MAREIEWGWLALGGLAVFVWMKSNTAQRMQPGVPPQINLPIFMPCVIDPTTGDCLTQETPLPGSPLPGVPDVNPAQTPAGSPGYTPILQDPFPGGGGSLPVAPGGAGAVGGPLLLTP